MDFKKVRLLHRTPRKAADIKRQIPVSQGLRTYFLFAYCMFLGAIGILLAAIFVPAQPYEVRVYQGLFGPLFFGAFGLTFYLPARKRLKTRMNCLINGNLVTAHVTRHGRVFVPYKSFRDYSVEAQYTNDEGKRIKGVMQSPTPEFQEAFPIGAEIQGLYEPMTETLFLPAEVGVEIVEY